MNENKINDILKRVLRVSTEDLKKDLGINDVENWDSLTHMTLIVDIENELNIELTGDEIAEMTSFSKIREKLISGAYKLKSKVKQ